MNRTSPDRTSSRSSWLAAAVLTVLLSACGSTPKGDIERLPGSSAPAARGGGYYLDDGPGDRPPGDLAAIPDPVPRIETLHKGTMRPYTVMGRDYTPMTRLQPYRARGIASWYGRRYHGKTTSNGERYDMYAMTAAHTVLPIPSYARVTNVSNGRSVVVRINDRGPFIDSRLIDLSYTAAWKLGILNAGSGMVEVESLIPGVTPSPATVASVRPPAAPEIPASDPAPATPVIAAPVTGALAEKPATAVTDTAAIPGGNWLQFGAFGVQANAEAYRAKLEAQTNGVAGMLRIIRDGNLFRVQAGPYATEIEARQAAARAKELLGSAPVLMTR
jgi:rare lipoprotein A